MLLREKQSKFVYMVGKLIERAYALDYELTFGDCYRDPRVHGEMGVKKGYGHPSSCHKLRLAIDLNLFIDGEYKTDTDSHRPLGEYWESLGGSWGGRFEGSASDGNHYSIEHEGVK